MAKQAATIMIVPDTFKSTIEHRAVVKDLKLTPTDWLTESGLKGAISAIDKGDNVVVLNLAGLGNSTASILGMVGAIKEQGAKLVFAEFGVDSDSKEGKAMLQGFEALYGIEKKREEEAEAERKREERAQKAATAGTGGSKKKMTDDNKLRMFYLFSTGTTAGQVASLTGYAESTVNRIKKDWNALSEADKATKAVQGKALVDADKATPPAAETATTTEPAATPAA